MTGKNCKKCFPWVKFELSQQIKQTFKEAQTIKGNKQGGFFVATQNEYKGSQKK